MGSEMCIRDRSYTVGIWQDGKKIGETAVTISGERSIWGRNYDGRFAIDAVEKTCRERMLAMIRWEKKSNCANITFAEPGFFGAQAGIEHFFYCDRELEGAHSAEADTLATYEVLKAQLDRYPELENDVEFLAKFTEQNRCADYAGRILYDKDGVEVFGFGKYRGRPVAEVFREEPGYYSWMMNGDFPMYTKKVITEIRLRDAALNKK